MLRGMLRDHAGSINLSREGSRTAYVKVTPKVISVLDYSKGFDHTDLVRP